MSEAPSLENFIIKTSTKPEEVGLISGPKRNEEPDNWKIKISDP
jgi:hypothetical protein